MADSEEVMAKLNSALSADTVPPEIIGIVVNEKGFERALATPGVTTIGYPYSIRSEEHTSELQSRLHLVCRLLLEKKNTTKYNQLTASSHASNLIAVLCDVPDTD